MCPHFSWCVVLRILGWRLITISSLCYDEIPLTTVHRSKFTKAEGIWQHSFFQRPIQQSSGKQKKFEDNAEPSKIRMSKTKHHDGPYVPGALIMWSQADPTSWIPIEQEDQESKTRLILFLWSSYFFVRLVIYPMSALWYSFFFFAKNGFIWETVQQGKESVNNKILIHLWNMTMCMYSPKGKCLIWIWFRNFLDLVVSLWNFIN